MTRVIVLISGDTRTLPLTVKSYEDFVINPNNALSILDVWDVSGELGSPIKVGLGQLIFRVLTKISKSEWQAQRIMRPILPILEKLQYTNHLLSDRMAQIYDIFDHTNVEECPGSHQFRLGQFEISDQTREKLDEYGHIVKLATPFAGFRNMMPMFYKIWSSYKLYENTYGYRENDIVVRLRPDLLIEKRIDFSSLSSMFDGIVVSKAGFNASSINADCRVPDQFFFGNASTMKRACNVVEHLEEHAIDLINKKSPSIGGEFLLAHHLEKQKIAVQFQNLHAGICR